MQKENPIEKWNRNTIKRGKSYRWNDLIRYANSDIDDGRFIIAFKKEKDVEYCIHCIVPKVYKDKRSVFRMNPEENPIVRILEIYQRKLRKGE